MKIHLVSYATPRFQLRQRFLGWSALANRVVHSVTHWSPDRLAKTEFASTRPDIRLNERGSGFWSWKPFVIRRKLDEIDEGDVVFYCDVGRLYPFKLIDQPVDPFLKWMEETNQSVLPGITAPWDGSIGTWTKRAALQSLDMDRPEVTAAPPLQASFSFWKATPATRELIREWDECCSQRVLVSDDPSPGLKEIDGFRAHRHDQALLQLICFKHGIRSLPVSETKPDYDSRSPSEVSRQCFGTSKAMPTPQGRLIQLAAQSIAAAEKLTRKYVKFGKDIHE